MTSRFDGFNYFLRLNRGEHLRECLEQFAQESKLEGAWLNGLGGATKVELGFYNLDTQAYQWRIIEETLEIVSLQGNLALDEQGAPFFHLHGVVANSQYQTFGGHVKDLVVGATCELFVHRAYKPLRRSHDDATGLPLLAL